MSGLTGNPFLLASAAGGAAGYTISRSLRFNSSDSAYLSRTPASAGNRKTWTWAGWVKRSGLGDNLALFGRQQSDDTNTLDIRFGTGDTLRLANWNTYLLETAQVFRDTSAWFHLVVVLDTTQATANNRARMYVNGVEITQFGTRSNPTQNADLAINNNTLHHLGATVSGGGGATYYFNGYLADIHFIDGQALTPSSFTEVSATTGQLIPKAYSGSFGTNGFWLKFSDNSAATATTLGKDYSGNSNNWTPNNLSVALDQNYIAAISATGASIDTAYAPVTNGFDNNSSTFFRTTNGSGGTPATIIFAPQQPITITSSLVFRGYIGANQGYSVQIGSTTLASGANDPSGNTDWTVPGASGLTISRTTPLKLSANNSGGGGEGVWWNYLSVDGSQLIFSASSIGANDSLVDTPTSYGTDTGAGGEVRGNYATLNPLDKNANFSLSNGNLDGSTGTATWRGARGTFGVTSGKWYFECIAGSADTMVGIADATTPITDPTFPGYTAYGYGYYGVTGTKYNNNVGTAYGNTYTANDIIGVAFDADNGKIFFSKNGVWQASGDPAAGTNAAFTGLTGRQFFPMLATYSTVVANFGQRPFAYTAPSGFKALCDTNLPAPVVAKPSTVMDVLLYTGNGSTQTISGLNFSPDLVWLKARSAAYNHSVFDAVRGAGVNLLTNATSAEFNGGTDSGGELIAFNSDGFNLGACSNAGTNNVNNPNGTTFAAWCWDAGSTTVTNTQGSITSSVRANPSAGFSVVTFTCPSSGAYSFGHGLNAAPNMVIMRNRGGIANWIVYHSSVTSSSEFLILNGTNSKLTASGIWGAGISSTVVGSSANVGLNPGNNAVAYCFAPVAGYSSFGSYTGNGSADGPFVYTGFRTRWVMVKQTNAAGENWILLDSARDTYNQLGEYLNPNTSAAALSTGLADFLSNGFKLRANTGAATNANAGTYIYAAFAESPFAYSRAR